MNYASYNRYNLPLEYYVYGYLREDNTFYYIGMGQGLRAWASHKKNNIQLLPTDTTKIKIIAHKLTKHEANLLETKLISYYGRKSMGTGILENSASGGAGSNTFKLSKEQCEKKKKITKENWNNEHYRNKTVDAIRKGTSTPEAKLKYSNAHKKQWETKREKIIAAQKEAHSRYEVEQNKSKVTAARWKDKNFIDKMTVICEHCNLKIKSKGAYSRWHGANCKIKEHNCE